MSFLIEKTPWLPAPPEDFSARCKALAAARENAGALAQSLATFALDANQSARFARALRQARAENAQMAPLSPFRLGVLASYTADLLLDCVPAACARHGVLADLVTAPYDQIFQQALDPDSTINRARADAVLLLVDHRWFKLESPMLGAAEAHLDECAANLAGVIDGLRDVGGAAAILCTAPTPPEPLFGGFDALTPGSPAHNIAELNRRIRELARRKGAYLLDLAALARRVGTDRWFDAVQWSAYKLPFAAEFNPVAADHIGRLLGAIRGKARKCLVLDLDNTCWGGVIGDDGLDGIQIGQGSARGEAFLSVQKTALDLRARGVMLAVCSKNTDAVAREPFRAHRDMLLRENHISVFQANWLDKPSNLEAIARTLNIGLDALVFLDDNPAERAQVRAALPMVAVPELPQDPSLYARTLRAAGYFEATTFSREDLLRGEIYASDARRAEVMTRSRDLGDYLRALEMELSISPFDAVGRQRIAQLINKSNQFNLTTRRYTEAEVAAMADDPAVYTAQARLTDKFGDLGMIAVAICRTAPDAADCWEIDSWLMSCRVLGRKIEEAMLAEIVADARRAGVARLRGFYLPTEKNGMVADHYPKLGFAPDGPLPGGGSRFTLALADHHAADLPIRVARAGAAVVSA